MTMRKAVYCTIHKYKISVECREPLHVGSSSGDRSDVLIRQTDDLPFIQAASISGVIRSYCESISANEAVGKLFGGSEDEAEGRIRITDGEFQTTDKNDILKLELRPRLKLDNVSGTVAVASVKSEGQETSGQKLEMQYVGAGAKFSFEIYVYDETTEEEALIIKALSALNAGEIQLGGQKSNGCGYITIESVFHKKYDMRLSRERKEWIEKKFKDSKPIILPKVEEADIKNAYEIVVKAATESELLVKGLAVEQFGKDAPKAESMKNAAGSYIIPGSSFKGAIRNRMEMIAEYMKADQSLITDAFGKTSDKKDRGKTGSLKFRDIVIYDENEKNKSGKIISGSTSNAKTFTRTRIRVDRFTGGVINGALFSELNVAGELDIHILIADQGNTGAVIGLLLFALRDLESKQYAIGSGQNIGKGYLNLKEIAITDRKARKKYCLKPDFRTISTCTVDGKNRSQVGDDNTGDGQAFLEDCMNALKSTMIG